MQIYLAVIYFLKVLLRQFRKNFKLIPSVPFHTLIKFNTYFNSDEAPEVLYLGDSVVERIADQDTDRRSLGQMVIDEIAPNLNGAVISFSAYHISVYHAFLKSLEVTKKQPKIVILPVNIRAFSPQWDLQPRWQYKEELQALEVYRKSSSKVIKQLFDDRYFVPKYLQNKYRKITVNYPLSSFSTIGQFLDIIESRPKNENAQHFRKKQIFIFNYAHPLVTEHRKLIEITKTLNFLFNLGIKVFVYITPINIDAGVKYVGEKFKNQILSNIQTLENVLLPYERNNSFVYSNWCLEFPSETFFYNDLATEHLNQNGRLKLSKLILQEVNMLLAKGK